MRPSIGGTTEQREDGVEVQRMQECRCCHREFPMVDFPIEDGRRSGRCILCRREQQVEARRRRLQSRVCLSCRTVKPFEAFTDMLRRTRFGMRMTKGQTCTECLEKKDAEVLEKLRDRAVVPKPAGSTFPPARGVDFTLVAQALLFGGRPYHRLTKDERDRMFMLAEALAWRFAPIPPPNRVDPEGRRESPVLLAHRQWAERFIEQHGDTLPYEVQRPFQTITEPTRETATP